MAHCTHEKVLDSVDVKQRPIRTCSSCGHRFVCLVCNDSHTMWLERLERHVPCTHCPVPCKNCRFKKIGAYCAHTPCSCTCHESKHYGYWNGMCPARKHGLDYKGQTCNLCPIESRPA